MDEQNRNKGSSKNAGIARFRGRLGEDDDPLPARRLPLPDVIAAEHAEPITAKEEEIAAQRDLDEMLGEFDPQPADDESEGEDIFDDELLAKDYEDKPELDYYSDGDLSEGSYEPMDAGTRRKVEQVLAERDARRAQSMGHRSFGDSRLPTALLAGLDTEDNAMIDRPFMRRKKKPPPTGMMDADDARLGSEDENDESDDDGDDEDEPNLEQPQGSLREFILTVGRNAIVKRFRRFLRTFEDKAVLVYKERIIELGKSNKSSLEVSWEHLSRAEPVPVLATWLVEAPAQMLPIFDEVAKREVLREYPNYDLISDQIFVRISSLPVADNLRDLRQTHLNAFIRVTGVVTRRTSVMPQLMFTRYNCTQCGALLGPFSQANATKEVKPSTCNECQKEGPFVLNMEKSVYRNYQSINLQETPGSIPPGRLPRSREVILLNDLVDSVRPGDEVAVTGIYLNSFDSYLNKKNGFPVFRTIIEANHLQKNEDIFEAFRLTEEDEKAIRQLATDEHIGERIVESIAPSIHGHLDIKTALALALFGGEPKQLEGDHRTRGDINVLLLGDPGVAKSQFLKYMEKTAHRAVYTTGQGASAVGLTAAVRKDRITREFTLEGGALVLADRGMCMIDEFDKMNDKDRTSIHEAMEQQSISISKAGIVTSLRARCSVVAAANPIRGRYDASLPFSKNVELTDAILSRFDVTCVVRDVVDLESDQRLASFVVQSHLKSHPWYNPIIHDDSGKKEPEDIDVVLQSLQNHQKETTSSDPSSSVLPPLSQDLLRKYVMYAKANVHPRLTDQADVNKLVSVYVEMRKEGNRGGVPMTVRYVESMVRMAEAHAKMHLRNVCNDDDINMAVRVMLNSFIQSQKFSVMQELRRKYRKYLVYKRDNNEILHSVLAQLVRDEIYRMQMIHGFIPSVIEIPLSELESRSKEQYGITDLRAFYRSDTFAARGLKLDLVKKVFSRSTV